MEKTIFPCLVHSISTPSLEHMMKSDGMDSVEEGIDCIILILHNAYKKRPISNEMWMLYP